MKDQSPLATRVHHHPWEEEDEEVLHYIQLRHYHVLGQAAGADRSAYLVGVPVTCDESTCAQPHTFQAGTPVDSQYSAATEGELSIQQATATTSALLSPGATRVLPHAAQSANGLKSDEDPSLEFPQSILLEGTPSCHSYNELHRLLLHCHHHLLLLRLPADPKGNLADCTLLRDHRGSVLGPLPGLATVRFEHSSEDVHEALGHMTAGILASPIEAVVVASGVVCEAGQCSGDRRKDTPADRESNSPRIQMGDEEAVGIGGHTPKQDHVRIVIGSGRGGERADASGTAERLEQNLPDDRRFFPGDWCHSGAKVRRVLNRLGHLSLEEGAGGAGEDRSPPCRQCRDERHPRVGRSGQ